MVIPPLKSADQEHSCCIQDVSCELSHYVIANVISSLYAVETLCMVAELGALIMFLLDDWSHRDAGVGGKACSI